MQSKVLYFPRGVEVMITPKSVVTDEFRQQIRDSFRDYTWGIHEDYRFEDKLAYINLIRKKNFKVGGEHLINEYIREQVWDLGRFSLDDFKDFGILESLINEGVGRSLKDWHQWSGDHHLDEPACRFVLAAIEEVMNYPENEIKEVDKDHLRKEKENG
ncbi:hypothetical protein [uncultured Acidaminococcus sp.]|uniref:hypothetical protein n=1 Tax=uncultured Acidaminococcus sp. TaxID=352152 RepID=UPI0025964A84|nr:hypothetical protein [uncultured Acidaminococcus sp.]